jgi:polar amino acid transport system substrate-binding protein
MKTVSGDWLGFDPEMMRAFSKYLGVKLVMMDTKWDGIIPSLVAGRCDVIASSMAKTKERESAVSFSDPYYVNKMLIAVYDTPENRIKYKSIEDFNSPNAKIAVKTGSSPDLFLQKQKLKAQILRFDADADTVSAVLGHKTTAFIYDTPYVRLAALNHPGKLYILPQSLGDEDDHFGVAFRKQDVKLREAFNSFLKSWKENGEYSKIEKYYFSSNEWMPLLSR